MGFPSVSITNITTAIRQAINSRYPLMLAPECINNEIKIVSKGHHFHELFSSYSTINLALREEKLHQLIPSLFDIVIKCDSG